MTWLTDIADEGKTERQGFELILEYFASYFTPIHFVSLKQEKIKLELLKHDV